MQAAVMQHRPERSVPDPSWTCEVNPNQRAVITRQRRMLPPRALAVCPSAIEAER